MENDPISPRMEKALQEVFTNPEPNGAFVTGLEKQLKAKLAASPGRTSWLVGLQPVWRRISQPALAITGVVVLIALLAMSIELLLRSSTPGQVSTVTAVPAPHSPLFGSFVWETDQKYGYRMLRPAGWDAVDETLDRLYLPIGSAVQADRINLEVLNLKLAADNNTSSSGTIAQWLLFENAPTLEGWTQGLEQSWPSIGVQFTLIQTLPNAKIYRLQMSNPPDLTLLVGCVVDGGQPLLIGMNAYGAYSGETYLRDTGLLDDFVTMVASANSTAANPVQPVPILTVTSVPVSRVLDLFPLQTGARWTYHSDAYTQSADPSQLLHGVTEIVESVESVQDLPDFQIVHVRGSKTLLQADPGWQDAVPPEKGSYEYWYLIQGSNVYRSNTQPDPTKLQTDLLIEEYQFPLGEGASWCPNKVIKGFLTPFPSEIPSPCEFIGKRQVEKEEAYTSPAGTFEHCYQIVDYYNTGNIISWFCDGVGLVAKKFDHAGTPFGFEQDLVGFAPAPGENTSLAAPTPDVVGTLTADRQPDLIDTALSPDGQWQAEVLRWDCLQIGDEEHAYEELRLTHSSDGAEQVIDSQLQNCGGLGAFGLGIGAWSTNSRYLYYTPAKEGSPDGSCWYWYRPLVALEVESGQKTQLQQGPQAPGESSLAFWDGNDLVLWSLSDGETRRLPKTLADLYPGPLAWANDGQSLVYIQNGLEYCSLGKSALVQVDLATGRSKVLLESQSPSFIDVKWETSTHFVLTDVEHNEWIYDAITRELKVRK